MIINHNNIYHHHHPVPKIPFSISWLCGSLWIYVAPIKWKIFVDPPPFVDPKMVQNISKYVFFDFIVSLNAFNKDMYPVNLG